MHHDCISMLVYAEVMSVLDLARIGFRTNIEPKHMCWTEASIDSATDHSSPLLGPSPTQEQLEADKSPLCEEDYSLKTLVSEELLNQMRENFQKYDLDGSGV